MAALVPFLGGRVTLVACAALCYSNANCTQIVSGSYAVFP